MQNNIQNMHDLLAEYSMRNMQNNIQNNMQNMQSNMY